MNNLALNRLHDQQDQGMKNAELLEDRRELVVSKAMDLAFEEIQLEAEAFKDIINGESLREGDYSEINVLMNKIEIAGRTNDAIASAKASMDLGVFVYRKWTDGIMGRVWDKAEKEVLAELGHDPREV